MIVQLREIFGDHLEYIVASVMSRTPLVIVGQFSEKELYYLVDISSPHRFVLFSPEISKDEAMSILRAELTEKSKRLILVFKDYIPSFISELSYGWIILLNNASKSQLEKINAVIIDLRSKHLVKTKKFDELFLRSVKIFISRLKSFEKLYGSEETRLFAHSIINSLNSQMRVFVELTVSKNNLLTENNKGKPFLEVAQKVFISLEYVPMAFVMYSTDYHIRLDELYSQLKDLFLERISRIEHKPVKANFVLLRDYFGYEILGYLISYILLGLPILIKTENKTIAKELINLVEFLHPNMDVALVERATSIAPKNQTKFMLYVYPEKLPNIDDRYIVISNNPELIEDMKSNSIFLIIDLEKHEYIYSVELSPLFIESLMFDDNILISNAVSSIIKKLDAQADLILNALQSQRSLICYMFNSPVSHLFIEDKLLLIGFARIKAPHLSAIENLFKLFMSIYNPQINLRIYLTRKITLDEIIDLLEQAPTKSAVLRILAFSSYTLSFLFYLGEGMMSFDYLQAFELLIRKGVIAIEFM
ncbi:MAG: hypothetical protein ACP6IS_04165 [Candidatus Asgardarchaeia archaeon]